MADVAENRTEAAAAVREADRRSVPGREACAGPDDGAEPPAGEAAAVLRQPVTSLRSRLALRGAALFIVLIASVLTANWFFLRRLVRAELVEAGTTVAALLAYEIAPAVEAGSAAEVERRLAGLFQSEEAIFASVTVGDGRRLAAVGDVPPGPPGPRAVDEPALTRDGDLLVIRTPVRDARLEPLGVLEIGFQHMSGDQAAAHGLPLFLSLGLFFTGLALLAGQMQARRLLAPLLALAAAAQAVRRGAQPPALQVRRDDEIGLVLRSFNEMAEHLRDSQREVHRRKEELEETVRQRTEELRRKNLALAIQNDRVLEASRLKSDFVANISHELRTPLNAILALSELLRDEVTGPLDNDEQRRQLDLIRQGGENLLRLINDVLDLSRIEAGRVEIRPVCADAADLLRVIGDEMRPLTVRKGIELKLELPEPCPLWFDPDRVGQVLRNLVGNAVKFTERGRIQVTGEADPREERLTFRVEDTGIGIAPQDQEAIFQEFRQVDGSATRRHGGTGLGLAICRRLVRLMGGEILLRSDLGQGATFTFWVSAFRACPARNPVPEERPASVLELSKVWEEECGEQRAA